MYIYIWLKLYDLSSPNLLFLVKLLFDEHILCSVLFPVERLPTKPPIPGWAKALVKLRTESFCLAPK